MNAGQALAPDESHAGQLRSRLVSAALEWQELFGVAPAITSSVSELDAALLIGVSPSEYATDCQCRTAVTRGCDFTFQGQRYQVKANRPSGKPGSLITLVGKAKNYEWDFLVWILYNKRYEIQEAWEWPVDRYRAELGPSPRLSPAHMRKGRRLV